MRALLNLAYEKIKQAPKKILSYLKNRTIETYQYIKSVLIAAVINAVIMIPLVLTAQLIMQMTGFKFPESEMFPGGKPPLWMLPFITLGIGIFEETYFRYLIMDCMLMRWLKFPAWLAIGYSSIAFGVMHFSNGLLVNNVMSALPQVIGATGAGFWFAYCYRKRGLHFAVMVHALYDFILMALMYI